MLVSGYKENEYMSIAVKKLVVTWGESTTLENKRIEELLVIGSPGESLGGERVE